MGHKGEVLIFSEDKENCDKIGSRSIPFVFTIKLPPAQKLFGNK